MDIICCNNRGLWLWCVYLMLAFITFFIWTEKRFFPVTGDEPHYLVMADGIINDGTLEQTVPYTNESRNRTIYPSGLTVHDIESHTTLGPNGYYNIHNIGLPLLLAIPYRIGGVIGSKIFMILLSSLVVIIAWAVSGLFILSQKDRIICVIASTFAAPLIPASNQIYPDIIAGVLSLATVWWILKKSIRFTAGLKVDLFIMLAVAYLPWLQIKFVAASFILTIGLCAQVFYTEKQFKKLIPFVLIFSTSLLVLVFYNKFAFGKFTGPYRNGALELSRHALMVLVGLHLDRFQGILMQNPSYYVGLLFLFPFLKRFKIAGFTILFAYLSFVVPNALHPNWYGGASFAGRFAWSGALTVLPIIIYGLANLLRYGTKKNVFLILIVIATNSIFYINYTLGRIDFINKAGSQEQAHLIPIKDYASFYWHGLCDFIPALYDSTWAFTYVPNAVFLLLCVGLILVGSLIKSKACIVQ